MQNVKINSCIVQILLKVTDTCYFYVIVTYSFILISNEFSPRDEEKYFTIKLVSLYSIRC